MTEPEGNSRAGGPLLEEAAGWFARMRAPDAEKSRPEFEAWLARSALNRAAYNRATEIFAMGKVLSEDWSDADPVPQPPPKYNKQRRLVLAAAGLSVLALSWLALRPADIAGLKGSDKVESKAVVAELSTGDRKPREVRLADGSTVELLGGSRLDIAFDAASRQLKLLRGSARFEVAHESRPFVVLAGGGSVTAHGTIFDVALSKDRHVSVRLIEGIVDVRLPPPQNSVAQVPTIRQMHRGEILTFVARADPPMSGSALDPVGPPSPAAIPKDAHDYDRIRVADLIADANRQASRPIRLTDSVVGDKRLSGRFRIDDTDLLAKRLAALFDLAVDESDPAAIVLKRK